MYTFVNFSSQIVAQREVSCLGGLIHQFGEGGLLSQKQGGGIHQFGVWLGRDLKIRLLLLLLLLMGKRLILINTFSF
jgi:hypothetical protein